jgi:uncharacterized cupredoxin-like copper-binding protein
MQISTRKNLAAHTLKVFAAGTVAVLAGFAAAHAGPTGQGTKHGHRSPATVYGQPGKASEVDRTVNVLATDMKFDIRSLRVKTGETIRFIVANKEDDEHDFTLGDTATQKGHREEMAKMMEGHNGMTAGMVRHDDPNAVFLKPGATKELIWKFSRAGSFEFACNVPGHYEAGMKGTIMVGPRSKPDARG